jgi:hypothetical protein
MRLSSSHPPESRRLLVAGSVRRIIGGLYFREPLHADGVNLSDLVFERSALDLILDLSITQDAFKRDELPLLEGLGELRGIPPGIDAVPFGAILVVALVVLPAFLGGDVEDDVLTVVLSGLASAFCPRRPMRMRVFPRALVNIDPYTFDDVAENFADDEKNQQTSEEILLSTIDGLPDDKLTGFALRLVITAHIPIPREGGLDYLAEAETAFAPPQLKKTASKKTTTKPTPIKAAKKGAAKKTTAQKEVAA